MKTWILILTTIMLGQISLLYASIKETKEYYHGLVDDLGTKQVFGCWAESKTTPFATNIFQIELIGKYSDRDKQYVEIADYLKSRCDKWRKEDAKRNK